MINDFKEHAKKMFPYECVGVIKNGKYVPLENKSEHPLDTFVADIDILNDEDITEILHTHTDGSIRPSYEDMRSQISVGLPMGIMGVYYDDESNEYRFTKINYLGKLQKDYLGLPYIFGINDCYSLVRNWYYTHKGIELLDFPRRWEFWKTENLLIDNAHKAGFKQISINEVEKGDVFFCTLHSYSKFPVHMGVLADDNIIEHHPSGNKAIDFTRLSLRENIQRYLPSITHWFRYVGSQGAK